MKSSKHGFLFCILPFLSIYLSLQSAVKEIEGIERIDCIHEAMGIFEQATQDDMFVFDVDDVILESQDPAKQSRFRNSLEITRIVQEFDTDVRAFMRPQQYSDFMLSLALQSKRKPVEEALIRKIHDIQARNLRVIALTCINTGKAGWEKCLEEWRYKQLLDVGIDFSSSFNVQNIVLDGLRASEHSKPAMFHKGILCTSGFAKGAVLSAFLKKIERTPKKIYFFDDCRENVESVVDEMKDLGIKCKGFVYNAAKIEQLPKVQTIRIIIFQYELMKQTEEYVSYSQAKELWKQVAQ
jgi:hypothetical protein